MESTQEKIKPRLKTVVVDRSQMEWGVLDLESLIAEDHIARTIWEVSGRLDLSEFEITCKTYEGEAGRPCWPARVLVSVWVYSYSMGVASARAIDRMMSHEPGLRWLSGDGQINYHTLADFRVGHKEALSEMFAQFLALLETAGMVDLKTLLHDGTKIKAVAGRASLHRHKTLERRVRHARRAVKKLDEKAASECDGEGMDEKRRAAQARAAREALKRAEAALEKMKKLKAVTAPGEQEKLRVSESEPEARNMKHADGGYGPSYNVQVTTEAQSRMIVGIGVTTAANDTQELMPAVERVRENCGVTPEKLIADNGYATRSNVEQTSEQKIALIAPWKDDGARQAGACKRNGIAAEFAPAEFRTQYGGKKLTCPAGKTLIQIGQKVHHELLRNIFEARQSDCKRCRFHRSCCGEKGGPRRIERVVESPAMKQHIARMKGTEAKELYKRRCEVAEFPHLWAKGVKNWRRFSVRGTEKAGMEVVWVAVAYNVVQWSRIQPMLKVAA